MYTSREATRELVDGDGYGGGMASRGGGRLVKRNGKKMSERLKRN